MGIIIALESQEKIDNIHNASKQTRANFIFNHRCTVTWLAQHVKPLCETYTLKPWALMLHLEWTHIHPYQASTLQYWKKQQGFKTFLCHFCGKQEDSDLEVKLFFVKKKKTLSFYIYMMLLISLKSGLLLKQIRKRHPVPKYKAMYSTKKVIHALQKFHKSFIWSFTHLRPSAALITSVTVWQQIFKIKL